MDKEIDISVDTEPEFELSPYLYMQFMEPLGRTDGSVEAAWDFKKNCWRTDVIKATKELAPTMIRWGGVLSSYYRWKEGVGPREKRIPMQNMAWKGFESNQVGTAEFIDFNLKVNAEPLICVNFESDGDKRWSKDTNGNIRKAGPEEAAKWVDYCNNPSNTDRIKHGFEKPFNVKYWQIGNETSKGLGYDIETAAKRTVVFAKAMRKVDPSIKIIAWGADARTNGWMKRMVKVAGKYINYIAFHHMFDPYSEDKNSPLRGMEYRKNFEKTWGYLMNACKSHEKKLNSMRHQVKDLNKPLAMTECHFAFQGRNRCEVLSTWAAGVAYARMMNLHERNGDILKIATLADFCGTRWQVNAVMIPVPRGESFLMPVAKVMSLYRKHTGTSFINVTDYPDSLDVTASRTDNMIFLHVVNTNRTRPIKCQFSISEKKVKKGRIFEISGDPEFEVFQKKPDPLKPKEKSINLENPWTFPAASVSAVELEIPLE